MVLSPNVGSDRSWVWNVLADIADGDPKQETLAIRFANSESMFFIRLISNSILFCPSSFIINRRFCMSVYCICVCLSICMRVQMQTSSRINLKSARRKTMLSRRKRRLARRPKKRRKSNLHDTSFIIQNILIQGPLAGCNLPPLASICAQNPRSVRKVKSLNTSCCQRSSPQR